MVAEQCYGFVCFIPLDTSGPKFFGFSEFLAGLALMVLAWAGHHEHRWRSNGGSLNAVSEGESRETTEVFTPTGSFDHHRHVH
jgi:hypothetical protein